MKCRLCDSKMIYLSDRKGYVSPDRFGIYFCVDCDIQSSDVREYDYLKLYNEIYNNKNIVGYSRYWHYANIIKDVLNPLEYLSNNEGMYFAVSQTLKKFKFKKILEVGSGLGYLTYSLVKEGYNCLGVDVSKSATKFSIERFGNYYINEDIFDYLDSSNEIYDLIIVNEVIEHINNPKEFISNLVRRLDKDGYLLFTTPNKSIFKKETIWATDSPPVHLHWFSEKSFSVLADLIGFKFEFIDFTDFHVKNKFILDINKAVFREEREYVFNDDFSLVCKDSESVKPNNISFKIRNKVKYFYYNLLSKFGKPIFVGGKQGKTLAVLISKT
jgi:2-polyprenyl-3-methyl-5-hydroxy-6-metoxy-1,4-benzoquinol methylase